MKIDHHLEQLKESLEEIEEAVRKGLLRRQRTLGFHASAAAMDMLEIMLHEKNLIDPGFIVKHEWFNSDKKIKEKIGMDFPKKEEIIPVIKKIEGARNTLCYGKRQDEKQLEEVVKNINKLKQLFSEETHHEL